VLTDSIDADPTTLPLADASILIVAAVPEREEPYALSTWKNYYYFPSKASVCQA
jgi:hypothetical protein